MLARELLAYFKTVGVDIKRIHSKGSPAPDLLTGSAVSPEPGSDGFVEFIFMKYM
jgi:hypothetical protein